MNKTRLEAFSDGVLAIIITIMVLELKVPHEATLHALLQLYPVFISYIISFAYIGIYWGNHHHLLHAAGKPSKGIMWANLHLLFWLSLIPFATAWMGENHFEAFPVACYAVVLDICGLAYTVLQVSIENCLPADSHFRPALKKQTRKGIASITGYTLAIPAAYIHPAISVALFTMVAIIWFIPDKNIEEAFEH